MRLGNKLRLTSRHVTPCRQLEKLEEVDQQLAWIRRQLLDSLEDRSDQDLYSFRKVAPEARITEPGRNCQFSSYVVISVYICCYRREMAAEERRLVHRHREVYRRHEGAAVTGARVVTCTVQTAARRSGGNLYLCFS